MASPAVGIVGILLALAVLGAIVAGIVLIVSSRRRGLGYPACGACKYDLSGSIGSATRCPECGADFSAVGILPAQGARRTGRLWAGIILLLIPLTCIGFGVLTSTMSAMRAAEMRRAAAAQAASQAAPQRAATPAATQPQSAPQPVESGDANGGG